MQTMLAAVLKDFNQLELEEIPIPQPQEKGTVLVRIKSCGICATDYKAIKGIRRNVTFPFIAGHEPAGIVAAVGPGVTHFKPGDEIICQPSGYCGYCKNCREGNTHYCENAFTTGSSETGWYSNWKSSDNWIFHSDESSKKGFTFVNSSANEPLFS